MIILRLILYLLAAVLPRSPARPAEREEHCGEYAGTECQAPAAAAAGELVSGLLLGQVSGLRAQHRVTLATKR